MIVFRRVVLVSAFVARKRGEKCPNFVSYSRTYWGINSALTNGKSQTAKTAREK